MPIRVVSDGSISKAEEYTRLWVYGHPGFNVYHIRSAAWEDDWEGYELHLWGDEVPTIEDAAPAAYQFSEGPDAWILTLYRACALIPGSPLIATLEIDHGAAPGKAVRGYIEQTAEREWVNDDLLAAGRALRLLQGAVQTNTGGRHRLEEDPDPGWLLIAVRAENLRRDHPHWEWKWIAQKVGVHVSTLRDYRRRRRLMNRP